MKATNLLHWELHAVSYRRIATAIQMASKVGTCCIVVSFAVALAERVVAEWRCPVASSEALVILHQVMRSVWHLHTAKAIEMANNGGAFVCHCRLFRLL